MKKLKDEKNRRKRLSVCINAEIYRLIEDNTTNKSRYIEFALLNYYKECGLDVSKIKL